MNYEVKRGITYFPDGVDVLTENIDQQKVAYPGDIISDLSAEDAKGLLTDGTIVETRKQEREGEVTQALKEEAKAQDTGK
jgi:hypothetical protein